MTESLQYFAGRDNAADLLLIADGAPVSIAGITRVRLEWSGGAVDSTDEGPAVFDWPVTAICRRTDVPGVAAGDTVDVIRVNLALADVDPFRATARLVVFDPDHAAGLVWSDNLVVRLTE